MPPLRSTFHEQHGGGAKGVVQHPPNGRRDVHTGAGRHMHFHTGAERYAQHLSHSMAKAFDAASA